MFLIKNNYLTMRKKYKMRYKNNEYNNSQINLTEQNINFNSPINNQRSKSPQTNVTYKLRNLYNQKKKISKISEIETKNEYIKKENKNINNKKESIISNNNNNEKKIRDKKETVFKTKSNVKNILKAHKIITKTLSIINNNFESKILKKQNDLEDTKNKNNNNKNIISEKLNNFFKKNVLSETNGKDNNNNVSKNEVKPKLSINTDIVSNNYIKKKALNMSKRTLYKNLNKPNTVRSHYVAYNTSYSKDKTFNQNSDKNELTFNNINVTQNNENAIKDIKNNTINSKNKKPYEIETKYIRIKPKEKKQNENKSNRNENLKEKKSYDNNLFIKTKKVDNIKENPNNKFYKINIRQNKLKKDDINESKTNTLTEPNNGRNSKNIILVQPKSLTSRINLGLYSRKKLKTDLSDDFIHNKTEALISKNEMKKPLQYLVQQIFRNNNFKNSFKKYFDYQKNKQKDSILLNKNNKNFMKNENNSTTINIDEINLNLGHQKSSTNKREISYEKTKNYKKIDSKNIYLGHNKTLSERKFTTKNKIYHHLIKERAKTIDNSIINDDKNLSLISNNVFNNNTFNTTVNYFNFNNDNNSIDKKNNSFEQNNIEISAKDLTTINNSRILIDIHSLYFLENKLKKIIENLTNYEYCDKECFNFINYYFKNQLYDEFLKLYKNKHNKLNALNQIKIELLCLFLCYDISNSSFYNQTAILLKTIFEIIYSNFLVVIYYILNQINNSYDYEIYNKLIDTVNNNLKIKLNNDDMNEFTILEIITSNSKNILNYYKIILDNIYSHYYNETDENIKFPQCLKIIDINEINPKKLLNIISVFFFDSYRLINNYNFNDLFNFFNLFLIKEKSNLKNNINSNCFLESKNINCNKNLNNFNIEYFLPPINDKYKYTLILDLDETLIFLNNKSSIINKEKPFNNPFFSSVLILRPGLIDFLKNMKQIYELIIFTSGTLEYVIPIIQIIEKKEKFFEYILYRKHISILKNGEYYKDLNLLNRNVKNTIIVDNISNNFIMHKSNGICIKPFYGDIINDRNTLKLLGNILQKIRYDAEQTGDIRKSLQKQKNFIYNQIATNIEKLEIN